MTSEILNNYHPGLVFNSRGLTEIVLWAPCLKKAEVTLPSKGITFPLIREELGYWTAVSDRIKPGDLYEFFLDGEKKRPDPASLSQPSGLHGPSMALNLKDFIWQDGSWQNMPLKEYLFYEIHTGTFTPEGTFAAIEEKLDYLKELGITAIEVMPVAQFSGKRNWGYDGAAPYAVQNSYGGPQGLQHLVNACHLKGLAVVLDVVYNHLGPEGNYLPDFGPYFTKKYNTPWGNAINFDDEYCYGVRQYFINNALMWLRDFHIDALRMDAVHSIKDFSPTHILREIKQQVDLLMEETGRKHYLIVELDLNDSRYINPIEQQGFGIDSQWIDEFHHALRVTAGEAKNGYYSDFEGISDLARAYKDAYVFDGRYSSYRKKFFGIKASGNPGQQFIVFSQNHDQVGNRMFGERTSQLLSFEMQKLMAAAVLMSPYLPMLFMGEEWSEPHPFLYFVSYEDQELAKAVSRGRKEEFAAFHARGEAPDPISEGTFLQSKLQWDLLKQGPHQTMLNYYKALISLRKQHPVLRRPERENLKVSANETTETLVLHRWQHDEQVLCLMNFSQEKQEITLPGPETQWKKLIYSADTLWNGKASPAENFRGKDIIMLEPESALVLGRRYS